MSIWKISTVIASVYAMCGIAVGLFLQTKFLSNAAYAVETLVRPNALQVRGAIVYVSDWEYIAFQAALYPSVFIIVVIVFSAAYRGRKRAD